MRARLQRSVQLQRWQGSPEEKAIVFVGFSFDESLRNSNLQRTLRSFARRPENTLVFHGVLTIEMTLPSKRYLLCGGNLKEVRKNREGVTR